jgi:hypothetical protein
MGDRQYDNDGLPGLVLGVQHDGARPVLVAFLLAARGILAPEEGVADDEAVPGLRERHAGLFHFAIEFG